jgi:hypothetical protein
MSLTLSKSKVDCKTFSGVAGRGFFMNEVRVGDYYIQADEFAELVMYYLTNTDLSEDDPRLGLMKRIRRLENATGFNGTNIRLAEHEVSP